MHAGTLRALEFDRIREALASFALTPLGATRLARLEPRPSRREVETGLAETTEGVRLVGDGPGVPLRAPADLEETLDALGVEGRPLEGLRLIALAEFLSSIDQARGGIQRLSRDTFPILTTLVEGVASFEREVADIRRAIDPAGDVQDHASPALRQIRDNLRRVRSRLRTTLESYVRGRDTARYLQDLVVTDRNGRYVLVVKAENRTSIPGIVHGSSASGASLYLEPLSTVELNNDIVDLQEREHEEVLRILLALTDAFRGRAEELAHTLEVATELDVIQAKARLAEVCQASAPKLSADGRLELRGARHPLLIEAVVARTSHQDGTRVSRTTEPVGVDILLIPPTRVLVITGPNTGGKTVALKSAGLLALMAQAGLHIPAEAGSQVPVFQSIFADIGDEQSIDANLSTFSWHITNIAAMDRALAPPALVLLDEVGAGTDPLEGGVLGMAMIDHFRQRGALVIATTHYDPLKSYASTTPEVTAAAFGFDPESFAPTYRLLYGSPGRSLALEMAARLGLPPSIVTAARAFRTEREAQLADHLAKMDRDLHALDHERRIVARERQQIADADAQYRGREENLRQREDQFKRKLEDALRERLREARREIDAVVLDVKKKATEMTEEAARRAAAPRLVNPRLSTGEMGSLRSDARAALEQVAARLRESGAGAGGAENNGVRAREAQTHDSVGTNGASGASEVEMAARAARGDQDEGRANPVPGGATSAGQPQPGDRKTIAAGMRVIISPLNLEGVVRTVHERAADVEVNGKRLRAQLGDLRIPDRSSTRIAEPKGRVMVSVQAQAPEGSLSDLNVIGCTVPEAIDRADKFLDQALLAELHQVRVIHGHGTGQLRRALAEFLHDHPLVLKVMPAPPEQGGGGVTLVELKE